MQLGRGVVTLAQCGGGVGAVAAWAECRRAWFSGAAAVAAGGA